MEQTTMSETDGKNWYVLYTRPRWEQKIYRALRDLEIEAYCPTYTEVREWSDRKKKVRCPYFKSFVFVKLEASRRDLVFRVPGVVRYLFWLGKPAVVREAEMEELHEYLDGDGTVQLTRLSVGDAVQIYGGVLKDRQAEVDKIGKGYVELLLPVLGYRIRVRPADLVP